MQIGDSESTWPGVAAASCSRSEEGRGSSATGATVEEPKDDTRSPSVEEHSLTVRRALDAGDTTHTPRASARQAHSRSPSLAASTPRRRKDMLANLQSNLSPKYIGFSTPPPTGTGSLEEETRSLRRRKLIRSADSSPLTTANVAYNNNNNDSNSLISNEALERPLTEFLQGVRQARSFTKTPHRKSKFLARKQYVSPIDKLLIKNGSTTSANAVFSSSNKMLEKVPHSNELRLQSAAILASVSKQAVTDAAPPDKNESQSAVGDVIENDQIGAAEHKHEQENRMNSSPTIIDRAAELPVDTETANKREVMTIKAESEDTEEHAEQVSVPLLTIRSVDDYDEMMTEDQEHEQSHENNTKNALIDSSEDCSQGNLSSEFDNITSTTENSHKIMTITVTSDDAKSPSAVSTDSAKGSSVLNGNSWLTFSTGDLYWGQIYSYCYWPCMVCPDPNGKTIRTESSVRNGEEEVIVHVRFFADNGRRNWVKRRNLMPFSGLENYKLQLQELRDKYGRNSPRYKIFLPKQRKKYIWFEAVREANLVADALYSERLERFYEVYERSKMSQRTQRKRRKSMIDPTAISSTTSDIDSLYDSTDNICARQTILAVKRERSISPFSPAYSPVKAATAKKIKLSNDDDYDEDDTSDRPTVVKSELTQLDEYEVYHQHQQQLERQMEINRSNSGFNERNSIASTTSSSTSSSSSSSSSSSLQDIEIFQSSEFKKFYLAMRDFVMEDNKDDKLERSMLVAVRNIWALKQINHTQIQRRLIENFCEQDLGSSLVETGRSERSVKRLSNRLKNIVIKRNLPQPSSTVAATTPTDVVAVPARDSRKAFNRPIEEVIDDIFSLDSKYLFKGLSRDPVCKYCCMPGGALQRCSQGCQAWLHTDCMERKLDSNGKSGRRRRKNKHEAEEPAAAGAPTTAELTDGDVVRSPSKTRSRGQSNASPASVNFDEDLPSTSQASALMTATEHITADEELVGVVCKECALKLPFRCGVCNKPEEDEGEQLITCNMAHCSKHYHPTCCRYWPQSKITKSKNNIESFRCPSHVCHTCVSDDPKGKFQHLSNSKLTRCIRCPASYHMDSTCIPAGSQMLTASHIICPRHSSSKADASVNVSWCFICVGGGQVICCETCPTAVHAVCLNIPLDPQEAYICEECESGRLPLYGEMVWAKFNSFRWWPAIILPPPEVPQNIMRKTHNPSDFVVRFFGTHDHGWISRRRVYLYLEGDSSEPPRSKSYLDQSYNRGVKEAKKIYEILKLKKQTQRLAKESKERIHPQPYVRIKANRAVPPLKLHIDLEKVNKCECNPAEEQPCGPESNCLNRVLYHECNPKLCPAGNRCENKMFESRVSPRLDVVYMKERGFGLVCREAISAGTFVIEYVGEIINDREFKQRLAQKSSDRDENFYFLSLEKDYIIDAGPKGNMARFMNHSCDPNCETQKWTVNGLNRVGLFAIKDIPEDTELTFNYHWDELLGSEKKTCYCGAAKCAGQIGSKYKEDKTAKEVNEVVPKSKGRPKKTKPLKRLHNKNATRTPAPTTKKKLVKVKFSAISLLATAKSKKQIGKGKAKDKSKAGTETGPAKERSSSSTASVSDYEK